MTTATLKACTEPEVRPAARLSWGVAGCGDVVRRRVVPALAASHPHRLAAIWGRDKGRATALAASQNVALATDEFSRLCAAVDAVYVATPVSSHLALTAAALDAGCHVLVEKPLNVGLAPVAPLLDRNGAGRPLAACAYYRRLAPALRWLFGAVRAGKFGRVRRVEVSFSSPFDPTADDPMVWRLDRSVAGAGVLADAGSHRIDLLLWLFGRPARLRAQLEDITPGGCERRAALMLQWPNGHEAACSFAWTEARHDRFVVEFERARVSLDPLDSGCVIISGTEGGDLRLEFESAANPHLQLIEDFERAVASGSAPACPIEAALDVDDVLLAAVRSQGHMVPIGHNPRGALRA
jgi:predicted dehydrogenase